MRSVGLFFSVAFFSFFTFTATYSGAGSFKSNKGDSGNYTVVANIESVDKDITQITQTIDFNDKTYSLSITLQKLDDNFYNVIDVDSGNVIGAGYCWTLDSSEDKICHSQSNFDGYVVELTVKKNADNVWRIGSKTNLQSGEKIIWKDHLTKQE